MQGNLKSPKPVKKKSKDEDKEKEKEIAPPRTKSSDWLLDYHVLIDSKKSLQLKLNYKEPTAKKPVKDDDRLELTLATGFGLRKPNLP